MGFSSIFTGKDALQKWVPELNAFAVSKLGPRPEVLYGSGEYAGDFYGGDPVAAAEWDRRYQAEVLPAFEASLSPDRRAAYLAAKQDRSDTVSKSNSISKALALGTIGVAAGGAALTGAGVIGAPAAAATPDLSAAIAASASETLPGAVPAAAGVYANPAYAAIPGAAKVATGGATDAITSALTSQLGKSFLPVIGAALGGAAIGAASSGGDGAPGTDPAVGTAISTNQGLSKEQAGFTREQWAQQMAYLAKISPMFDAYAKSNLGNLAALDKQTGEQFSDYSTLYRPVQEAYIGDVMRAGSEAEQAAAAARAGAGVQTQLDVQREIDARNMASMGVSPESGRFSSDRVTSVLGAAARAGAENAARVTERDRGTTLKAQATGLGLNLANVAQQGVQVGNQTAGTGASVASVPFNLKQAGDAQFQAGLSSAGALNTAAGQLAADASRINTAGWVAKQGVTNQNLSGLGSLGAFLYKALG